MSTLDDSPTFGELVLRQIGDLSRGRYTRNDAAVAARSDPTERSVLRALADLGERLQLKEQARRQFAERVVDHLADIASGECTLTDDDILAADSDVDQLTLQGLMNLHEDLELARWEASERALRTLEIKNEALSRAATELERSNQELERFAYVASHDLQEPLRMVASYCALLSEEYAGALGGRGEDYLNFAVDGATRMQGLINDLLKLSRVRPSQTRWARVDLNAVLREVVTLLKAAIDESGAVITCTELPRVHGDAVQLRQLLQNLVANAIKFRGESSPRVRIEAVRCDGRWNVSVADDGIGIAPEHHERIVRPFQRLHGRDEYPGSGIGLALAKRVAECHGGELRLRSELGAGATFTFSVPAERTTP